MNRWPAAAIAAAILLGARPASAEASDGEAAWGFGAVALIAAASIAALVFFGRAWLVRRRRLFAFLEELPGGVAVYHGRRVGPFWHSPAYARLLGSPVLLPAEGIAEPDRPKFVA